MMTLKERRSRFPASMSDEEFLLRAVMPAEQVDRMRLRAPHDLYYNPALAPVLQLLKGLNTREAPARFFVQKNAFSLTLTRREHQQPATIAAEDTAADEGMPV